MYPTLQKRPHRLDMLFLSEHYQRLQRSFDSGKVERA
jgi:hypothetical protein